MLPRVSLLLPQVVREKTGEREQAEGHDHDWSSRLRIAITADLSRAVGETALRRDPRCASGL